MAMLKDHPERACAYFAVDYQPEVGFPRRIPEAAEVLQAKLKTLTWGISNTGGYFFRVPAKRLFFTVEWQRFYAQSIGVLAWQSNLNEYGALFKTVVEKIGAKTLKRIGFKVQAFLPTGMSHAEMVDVMYGSFLPPAKEFESLCEKPEDALVQIHGTQGNMKLQLIVAPMNEEQAGLQVGMIPNLEHFLEPKFFDTGLKEFRDRVVGNCLLVDMDLYRQNIDYGELPSFVKESFAAADRVATATVLRLKSLRSKRGER